MREKYAASDCLAALMDNIPYFRTDHEVEELFRAALEKNGNVLARGKACYGLAQVLRRRWTEIEKHRQLSSLKRTSAPAPWPGADPRAVRKEVEALLERTAKEYWLVDWGRLGKQAKADLEEIRTLSIGSKAPEIEGADAAGERFKLSDYRGKVVVLDYWASWCGPCLAMMPHQRELVKRLADKPFALLGVNVDDKVETLQKAAKDKQMSWRHWFDGAKGPIRTRWNVSSFPTIYVLDAQGVIRYRDLRGEELDAAVDHLLAEAAPESGKPP